MKNFSWIPRFFKKTSTKQAAVVGPAKPSVAREGPRDATQRPRWSFTKSLREKIRHWRKPPWVIVFQLLFAEATIPGLRNVFGFSPPLPRVVFAVMFLYMVHTTVLDITELVTKYLEFNTTLQVTIEEPKIGFPLLMPAVTVCNYNPILLTKLCSPANRAYIEAETNKTCAERDCENFITLFYETLCLENDRESLTFVFGRRNNTLAKQAKGSFFSWYIALMGFEKGRELLTALSYSPGTVIGGCSFNGKDCMKLVTQSLFQTYGTCYCVFCNSTQAVTQFEKPQNGLWLNLRVQEDDYLPMLASAGHLVMIHEPDEEIAVSLDGVFVHPLATTYIGLQKREYVRLEPPSRDPCTKTYPAEIAGYLPNKARASYSMLTCQEMCTQMAIYRTCNCIDFKYRLPDNVAATECSYVLGRRMPHESPYKDTMECARDVADRMKMDASRCGCLQPCHEVSYRKINSALFWHPQLQRESLGSPDSSNSTVYVFMQSNNIDVRSKVMQITIKDLLNSIAGTMGLYLGYSYLCALYLIDILIRGVVEIVHWSRFQKQKAMSRKDVRLQE